MITRSELLEGWSAEEIVTVSGELLAGVDLSAPARRLLAEVGLPRTFPYYFTAVADDREDPGVDVADRASLIGPYRWRDHELLRLGSNYGEYVCLEPRSGHVLSLPRQGSDAPRSEFMNSSVQAFAAFLLRVRLRQLAGGLDEFGDEELEARARVFAEALRALDPLALVDEEAFWSVMVEQMGYGHR